MTRYHYCKAGCGFILYDRQQDGRAIWETNTMSEMLAYMKANGVKDVEYRRVTIAVIR